MAFLCLPLTAMIYASHLLGSDTNMLPNFKKNMMLMTFLSCMMNSDEEMELRAIFC
jgi:hypothetical protein